MCDTNVNPFLSWWQSLISILKEKNGPTAKPKMVYRYTTKRLSSEKKRLGCWQLKAGYMDYANT